jgi:hypothetical protein
VYLTFAQMAFVLPPAPGLPNNFAPPRNDLAHRSQLGSNLGVSGPVRRDADGNRELTLEEQQLMFFGPPMKDTRQDPYAAMGIENKILPDAWVGKNNYIRQVLLTLITGTKSVWVDEILPWQDWDGGDTVSIKRVMFNQHMLDRIPEQGVPRLTLQHSDTETQNIDRMGLAFHMENGFAMTAQGREDYAMNLLQIREATIETACYGVVVAILNAPPRPANFFQAYGLAIPQPTVKRIFDFEALMWGILGTSENGFLKMQAIAKECLSAKNVVPDTLILPYGCKDEYKFNHPETTEFMRAGPRGPERLESEGGPIAAQATMRIIESRPFHRGERDLTTDPFRRHRGKGVYWSMSYQYMPFLNQGEKYPLDCLDIQVLDCDSDTVRRIGYWDALGSSGLFAGPGLDAAGGAVERTAIAAFDDERKGLNLLVEITDRPSLVERIKNVVMGLTPARVTALCPMLAAVPGVAAAADYFDAVFAVNPVEHGPGLNQIQAIARGLEAFCRARNAVDDMPADSPFFARQLSTGLRSLCLAVYAASTRGRALDNMKSILGAFLPGGSVAAIGMNITQIITDPMGRFALALAMNGCHRVIGDPAAGGVAAGDTMTIENLKAVAASYGIPMPFELILARPHEVWDMGSAIAMKRGAITGSTLIGHGDFELGRDVNRKMLLGYYTVYLGSVIKKPENIYVCHNCKAFDYMSGGGIRIYDVRDANVRARYSSGQLPPAERKDVFAMYAKSTVQTPIIDICGRFPPDIEPVTNPLHYGTADIYREIWGWESPAVYLDSMTNFMDPRIYNVRCWLATHYVWGIDGSGRPNARAQRRTGGGPFGPSIYPGCVADACGRGRNGRVLDTIVHDNANEVTII